MLFPSTLLIADNQVSAKHLQDICGQLDTQLSVNNPDLFLIDQSTGYGIDRIRSLKKFLFQKPFNHQNKLIIIKDAHLLETPSQNALLKILEEPGPKNYLVLTTPHPSNLLPTIVSRCHLLKPHVQSTKSTSQLLTISHDPKKNLQTSEKYFSNKDQILPLLEDQLQAYHQQLLSHPSAKTLYIVKILIKSISMIKANVDPKSALDYFFLA